MGIARVAPRLVSYLAVVLVALCTATSAQLCLDNQVPSTSVGYVQVCWSSPGTVVFNQLTWVDNELNTWSQDLTSYAMVSSMVMRRKEP